eukprot:GHVT01021152.1.p1 GENE.GHVT01021152.1~~GHVT01021152.1.p1  ORF type:complete len:877 (-),score=90.90 GHVT01021152.1:1079-3709(-)
MSDKVGSVTPLLLPTTQVPVSTSPDRQQASDATITTVRSSPAKPGGSCSPSSTRSRESSSTKEETTAAVSQGGELDDAMDRCRIFDPNRMLDILEENGACPEFCGALQQRAVARTNLGLPQTKLYTLRLCTGGLLDVLSEFPGRGSQSATDSFKLSVLPRAPPAHSAKNPDVKEPAFISRVEEGGSGVGFSAGLGRRQCGAHVWKGMLQPGVPAREDYRHFLRSKAARENSWSTFSALPSQSSAASASAHPSSEPSSMYPLQYGPSTSSPWPSCSGQVLVERSPRGLVLPIREDLSFEGPTLSAFYRKCDVSIDFAFPSLKEQLALAKRRAHRGFKPGDVVITRHSTLGGNVQVVFHLIVPPAAGGDGLFTQGGLDVIPSQHAEAIPTRIRSSNLDNPLTRPPDTFVSRNRSCPTSQSPPCPVQSQVHPETPSSSDKATGRTPPVSERLAAATDSILVETAEPQREAKLPLHTGGTIPHTVPDKWKSRDGKTLHLSSDTDGSALSASSVTTSPQRWGSGHSGMGLNLHELGYVTASSIASEVSESYDGSTAPSTAGGTAFTSKKEKNTTPIAGSANDFSGRTAPVRRPQRDTRNGRADHSYCVETEVGGKTSAPFSASAPQRLPISKGRAGANVSKGSAKNREGEKGAAPLAQVLEGLGRILQTASAYGICSLAIPLLLLVDGDTAASTVPYMLLRDRALHVLQFILGHMRHGMGGKSSCNLPAHATSNAFLPPRCSHCDKGGNHNETRSSWRQQKWPTYDKERQPGLEQLILVFPEACARPLDSCIDEQRSKEETENRSERKNRQLPRESGSKPQAGFARSKSHNEGIKSNVDSSADSKNVDRIGVGSPLRSPRKLASVFDVCLQQLLNSVDAFS